MGVDPDRTALMGTAANMAYVAHHWAHYEEVHVDAFVTAGISGNAARAGDPAQWLETDSGWSKCSFYEGTINTILLFNCPVTPSAHASAVVTMTEAKSAALAELAIPSLYSPTIATGTGTDQFCLAAPLYPTQKPKGSTSVVFHFVSTKFFRLFRCKAEEFCGLIHYCRKELQWRA